MSIKLYDYFRSSAAFRVRIALNLKGLSYEQVPVHLRTGEQRAVPYRTLNPQQLVPALETDDGVLTQSVAIMEYLDEMYPEPPLLPGTPAGRARVRALALTIACEMHPLNNLRVLNYLEQELGIEADGRARWYCHWIRLGFEALEARLTSDPETGAFCHGDEPGLADCCLVPQVFNAKRFDCALDPYPALMAVFERCMAFDAFRRAEPSRQPDAE